MERASAAGGVAAAETENIRLLPDVSSEWPTNSNIEASTTQATKEPTYRVLNQPGGLIGIGEMGLTLRFDSPISTLLVRRRAATSLAAKSPSPSLEQRSLRRP